MSDLMSAEDKNDVDCLDSLLEPEVQLSTDKGDENSPDEAEVLNPLLEPVVQVEEKMQDELDESLLEPAVELSTEENEAGTSDQFFLFNSLAVEINEDPEENDADKEDQDAKRAASEENSMDEAVENGEEASNINNEICNQSAEEALADSTIPESNESSHDAMTYEEDVSMKSEAVDSLDMSETNLNDFIYSKTSLNLRFPEVAKAIEMADYETLQIIYQLLYQRSAWDTQEILKQRILEFSGFNFSENSEEYFNIDMMLKTQPNEVLVKIGQVLGLEQLSNLNSGGDKARIDLITAIMKFFTSMTRVDKPRRSLKSTDDHFDEVSNSTSDEDKKDIKRPQLYRFPKVVKAVEMAEYETLQIIYQLLYQRSAWDTQEILKQRILEFSGFNFSESSEEYFNRDMMLKTQPNEVLVKIGHVLGLEQIRNMYSGGDKARIDLILAIMQFLTSMKSSVKPRRRIPKSSTLAVETDPKNLITRCGCRSRCLAKRNKIKRKAYLEYLKDLETKGILDSYLFNLIEVKHNARKPGEEKQKFREYAYQYKVRFGSDEFLVCKGGFAVYHGLTQRKLQVMQNLLKNGGKLPPKMDMKEFPTFIPPGTPTKRNSQLTNYEPTQLEEGASTVKGNSESDLKISPNKKAEEESNKSELGKCHDVTKPGVNNIPYRTYGEDVMSEAIAAVKSGKLSRRKAAEVYNVSRKTLGNRLKKESEIAHPTAVKKEEDNTLSNDSLDHGESESTNEETFEKKKLKDFPLVVTAIECASKELLIDVHFLLFLNSAEQDDEVKKNILNFSGFTFDSDTEEYDERKEFLQRMSFKIVGDVARSFSLEIKENKEDTIKNILLFLQKPDESYLTITSSMPLSLSDVELDDIEGFSDSDESITCEVVEKKVECIDLISSGEDSDDDKPGKDKSSKKSSSSKVVKNNTSSAVFQPPPSSQTVSQQEPEITSPTSFKSGQRCLRDFETICKIVNTHPHEYLIDIYDLLYMQKHDPNTLRQEILDFTGFTFERGSSEYVKRKQLLDRMLYNSVRRIYNTLIHNTTEVKVFSKPTMITEIFQFLFKLPDYDTSVRPQSSNKPASKPPFLNAPKNAPVGTVPPPGIPLGNQSGKLSDLKRVFQRVACFPCEYLIDVHKLLFMTDCDPKVIRQNIFAFKGFKFGPESQEFQQRKMYLEYLTFHSLRKISSVLTTRSVDLRNSTKHELATHLTQVLAEYCNTCSDTEVPEIKNNNQNTTVTSSSNSSSTVEKIVVTPSLDPSLANPPVEPIVSTSSSTPVSATDSQKSSSSKKTQSPKTQSQVPPLSISIVDARSVPPSNKRKRKSNQPLKNTTESNQLDGNQFADINLPEVEKYRQMYGQNVYNPNLSTITGITTFNTTIPQAFPIGPTMTFPYLPVQPSQVIGVPVISQVQSTPPSEVVVPSDNANQEETPSKKQKISEKVGNSKTEAAAADDDEEDCDKPLASLIGHPIDSVLKKNISDIVEKTDLQDITINGVIQKIYGMYPKFDLSYRKEFIKSTVRSLLYKLGEQNIKNADPSANSPDCSVSTTDIQDNSLDETSMECSL